MPRTRERGRHPGTTRSAGAQNSPRRQVSSEPRFAPDTERIRQFGDQIDGFAQYLEQTSVQNLLGDAENFARQHSSWFLGGALALWFAASRFIKGSTPT